MKFTEEYTYKCKILTTEDGIEYRTDEYGSSWERRYGESWESVYLDEEDRCQKAYNEYINKS